MNAIRNAGPVWVAVFLVGCATHRTVTKISGPTTGPDVAAQTPHPAVPAASDADPVDTLPYLACDELQGRGVGLPGLDRAADFIAGEFAADGLRMPPGYANFFQAFDYTTQASPDPATALVIGDKTLALGSDYLPMRFSAQGSFAAPVVFVGYGVSAPEAGYDDYAGVDVKGKVVVAMRYEPMDVHGQSRLAPPGEASGWSDHATFSAKAKAAAEQGAAALLIVNPPDSEPDLLMAFSGAFGPPATIPVLQIKQTAADQLLAAAGRRI